MWKVLRFGLLLSCSGIATGLQADRVGLPGLTYDQVVDRVLQLTNEERAHYDLPPLKLNAKLTSAAEWMAMDMAKGGYVAHTDTTGRGIAERVPSFGYKDYWVLRENLAGGHESPEEVVKAWMESPGHRKNLLCDRCTEIGIAFFYDPTSRHRRYWVQEFGKPSK